MKKIVYIASSILLLSSCVKDVLDKKPIGRELSSTFFTVESNAVLATNALYDPIQREEGYIRGFTAIAESRADLTKVAGASSSDQLQGQQIAKYQQLADNTFLNGIYKWSYVGIQRCNTVLENAKYGEVPYNPKEIRGQAYFMRAFYYADLVRIYGPVQLVTASVGAGNLTLGNRAVNDDASGNKQVEAIYKQIISDLDSAVASLPVSWGASDVGRATKGAALGLLCRTYMYVASNQSIFVGDKSQYWNKASDAASAVMSDGVHSLVPDYHQVFSSTNENNSESLFEIQAIDGSDADFRAEGNIRALDQTYRYVQDYAGKSSSGVLGYGLNSPTLAFVQMFDVENIDGTKGYKIPTTLIDPAMPAKFKDIKSDWDPRLDLIAKPEDSVYYPWPSALQWVSFYYDKWKWGISEPFYNRKTELAYNEFSGKGGQSSFRNWVYFRLAEVILYKAEAELMLGSEVNALKAINMVRSRARSSKIEKIEKNKIVAVKTGKYPVDLNEVSMDDIIKERALELGGENGRFFDLVRTGYASKILANVDINESISASMEQFTVFKRRYTTRDAILQIPTAIIIEGQGMVKQNEGY